MTSLYLNRCILRAAVVVALLTSTLLGRVNTGTIVDDVRDAQGLAVSGAHVILRSTHAGDERNVTSKEPGIFSIVTLHPGEPSIKVSMAGLRTSERRRMMLTSNGRLAAGSIVLAVGRTTGTVTVSADTAVVQTANTEDSAILELKQISMILTRSRYVLLRSRLMPGVCQNSAGKQVNSRLGQVTGARVARVVQFALTFRF